MDTLTVMKQALEALGSCRISPNWSALQPAITALRVAIASYSTAIEQAAVPSAERGEAHKKQEPVAWMDGYRNIYSLEEKAAGCEDAVIPLVPAIQHWSDCAVHNEPAYPKGVCDCGGYTTQPAAPVQEPLTLRAGDGDCSDAERLCAELNAKTSQGCTHERLGFCALNDDNSPARWGCVMCGKEFIPKPKTPEPVDHLLAEITKLWGVIHDQQQQLTAQRQSGNNK